MFFQKYTAIEKLEDIKNDFYRYLSKINSKILPNITILRLENSSNATVQ